MMTDKRSPIMPDVPTFKELGNNFTSGSSRGFSIPKNTPKAIIGLFADAVKQVMGTPGVQGERGEDGLPVRLPGTGGIHRLHQVARRDLSAPLGQIREITGRG